MKSRSISNHSERGFTLFEVIVVMAMLAIVAYTSIFFSFDAYKGYLFRAEYEKVIHILQMARNHAMNNVAESEHGVHFEAGKYVLFRGGTYDKDAVTNEPFPLNENITLLNGDGDAEFDIIFAQLSGVTAPEEIVMSDGRVVGEVTIEINGEGRINW